MKKVHRCISHIPTAEASSPLLSNIVNNQAAATKTKEKRRKLNIAAAASSPPSPSERQLLLDIKPTPPQQHRPHRSGIVSYPSQRHHRTRPIVPHHQPSPIERQHQPHRIVPHHKTNARSCGIIDLPDHTASSATPDRAPSSSQPDRAPSKSMKQEATPAAKSKRKAAYLGNN